MSENHEHPTPPPADVRVLFTDSVTTHEARPQHFQAGEVYLVTEPSAQYWVNRGLARRVDAVAHPQPVPVADLPPEIQAEREKVKSRRRTAPATAETSATAAREEEAKRKAELARERSIPPVPPEENMPASSVSPERTLRDDGTVKGAAKPTTVMGTGDLKPATSQPAAGQPASDKPKEK